MITVHDTRCKFPLRNIIGPYIIGDSIDVRNHSLLTGSYCADECLEIWDLRNYERISAFNWNNSDSPIGGQVVAAKFTKGSTNGIIAASKIENELKMINSTTGEPFESVKGFSSMIYSMDISYEGNYISIGNADGTVSLFEYH